jgi:hypothetical protein
MLATLHGGGHHALRCDRADCAQGPQVKGSLNIDQMLDETRKHIASSEVRA